MKNFKSEKYNRIRGSVSIECLQSSKIVVVGTGGSYSLCESLVRSGVGHLTLIDFDTVEDTNIIRQGFMEQDIGKLKVDALKSHLSGINKDTTIECLPKSVLELTDQEYESFGNADLCLFLTDSFEAQAYGNKLALKYARPAIFAGYYEKSRCLEIFFYIPGVTPSCFRCATSPRYEYQKNDSFKANSFSNTIFHSMLLDSIIGMLSMAILHKDIDGYEFSNWFGKSYKKNFLQMKVHPSYDDIPLNKVKERLQGNAFNFHTIWQTINPERPPEYDYYCPDCGGKMDLPIK